MKTITIILASGVLAGLGTYAFVEWRGLVGIAMNDLVTMRISVFVGILAAAGFGSAAIALGFGRAFRRADDALLGKLEERIRSLETRE